MTRSQAHCRVWNWPSCRDEPMTGSCERSLWILVIRPTSFSHLARREYPKGVLGTQVGLASFLEWMSQTFAVNSGRPSVVHALDHPSTHRFVRYSCPSFREPRLVIAPEPVDPDDAIAWIGRSRVTILNATPSHAALWLDCGWRSDRDLPAVDVFFRGASRTGPRAGLPTVGLETRPGRQPVWANRDDS